MVPIPAGVMTIGVTQLLSHIPVDNTVLRIQFISNLKRHRKMQGCHTGKCEDYCVLECNTIWFGKMFAGIHAKHDKHQRQDLEDGGSKFIENQTT
jgi:hypothetical protein